MCATTKEKYDFDDLAILCKTVMYQLYFQNSNVSNYCIIISQFLISDFEDDFYVTFFAPLKHSQLVKSLNMFILPPSSQTKPKQYTCS